MRLVLDKSDTQETFRRYVLDALDKASRETFNPGRNDAGATDADLPRLFKAVDVQIETLAKRFKATLVEPVE